MRRGASATPVGRVAMLGTAGVLVLLALTACAGPPPELDRTAAAELQQSVLEVTQAVAAERFDAATTALSQTRTELEEAVDAGMVSASRYRTIDDALETVAAELTAMREALAADKAALAQARADAAAAEQAAAEQAAADQAAADQAAAQAAAEATAAEAAAAAAATAAAPVPAPPPSQPAAVEPPGGSNANRNGNGADNGNGSKKNG